MAFLMRKGTGKAVCMYSSCADEDYCKAELLVLLAKVPGKGKVIGMYDLNPALPVGEFLKSYAGREAEFEQALRKVRAGEFKFEEFGLLRLTPGVEQSSPTEEEKRERIETLKETVEHYLPEFATGVQTIAKNNEAEKQDSQMVIHQDAFAAGYHRDEYTLLGLAVKYAGLHEVSIVFHGRNE